MNIINNAEITVSRRNPFVKPKINVLTKKVTSVSQLLFGFVRNSSSERKKEKEYNNDGYAFYNKNFSLPGHDPKINQYIVVASFLEYSI